MAIPNDYYFLIVTINDKRIQISEKKTIVDKTGIDERYLNSIEDYIFDTLEEYESIDKVEFSDLEGNLIDVEDYKILNSKSISKEESHKIIKKNCLFIFSNIL